MVGCFSVLGNQTRPNYRPHLTPVFAAFLTWQADEFGESNRLADNNNSSCTIQPGT